MKSRVALNGRGYPYLRPRFLAHQAPLSAPSDRQGRAEKSISLAGALGKETDQLRHVLAHDAAAVPDGIAARDNKLAEEEINNLAPQRLSLPSSLRSRLSLLTSAPKKTNAKNAPHLEPSYRREPPVSKYRGTSVSKGSAASSPVMARATTRLGTTRAPYHGALLP